MAELRNDLKNDSNISSNPPDPKNVQELSHFVTVLLQQMEDRFQSMSDQILSRIDEMGNRIDDLERNISDLMAQAGPEEGDK